MLLYLITVDVKFVHLVKLVSAFLHCQATIFSFVVGKYHGGDTLGQCKSFFFFFIQTFIHWKILSATVITGV